MSIIAKASGGNFTPAPAGAHSAVCVDVVDLGVVTTEYSGKKKSQHKIRVVWQLAEDMEDGKPFMASKRYTLSLHEKATLRKELESWRGRAFTEDELRGFDVETVIGVPCFINIVQESKGGTTYSNVTSIMKLPKGVVTMKQRDYVRVQDRDPKAAQDANADAAPEHGEFPSEDDIPF